MKFFISFLALMIFASTGCSKSENETTQESVAKTVKTGDWMVIYMENNAVVDIGNAFIKFNANGTLVATKDNATYNGTWSETTGTNSTLTLNISTADTKLQKANKTWKVTRIDQSFIDLKDSNVAGNASVQLMKH